MYRTETDRAKGVTEWREGTVHRSYQAVRPGTDSTPVDPARLSESRSGIAEESRRGEQAQRNALAYLRSFATSFFLFLFFFFLFSFSFFSVRSSRDLLYSTVSLDSSSRKLLANFHYSRRLKPGGKYFFFFIFLKLKKKRISMGTW